jgi:hypothetical protein
MKSNHQNSKFYKQKHKIEFENVLTSNRIGSESERDGEQLCGGWREGQSERWFTGDSPPSPARETGSGGRSRRSREREVRASGETGQRD